MGTNRHKYIHNTARTIMGQIGISPSDFPNDPDMPGKLAAKHGGDVLRVIGTWSDETKGKLAACARPHDAVRRGVSLKEVFPGGINGLEAGGEILLALLAAGAVLAAMADNIRAQSDHFGTKEVDGFLVEITKVVFKAWVGIDLSLTITKLDKKEKVECDLHLDKDDQMCEKAGLCERGRNFATNDKLAVAKMLLDRFSATRRDCEGAFDICLDGDRLISWHQDEYFYQDNGVFDFVMKTIWFAKDVNRT